MSHYDELRERDASMTMEEKEKVRDADLARKQFISYEFIIKGKLYERYMKKHGKINVEYSHSKDYWDSKSKEMLKLISKLNKKNKE